MSDAEKDLVGKLEDHRRMKAALSALKEQEMDLRVDICNELGIESRIAGTHNFDFEDEGLFAKMQKKYNYKIDQEILNEVKDLLTEEEKACIKWTAELRVGGYKKLATSENIDMILTVTNAAPSLDVSLKDY